MKLSPLILLVASASEPYSLEELENDLARGVYVIKKVIVSAERMAAFKAYSENNCKDFWGCSKALCEFKYAAQSDWDTELNLYLWMEASFCLDYYELEAARMAKDLFFKFAKLGDLRPLKYLLFSPNEKYAESYECGVDCGAWYRHSTFQLDLIGDYLAKYRLTQIIPRLSDELQHAVLSLDADVFKNPTLVKALAVLLSDRSRADASISPIEACFSYLNEWGNKANDVIIKSVFMRVSQADFNAYRLDYHTSIEMSMRIKELCSLKGFNYKQLLNTDHQKLLFTLIDRTHTDDHSLKVCFEGFLNYEWKIGQNFDRELSDHFRYFLNMIHDRWPNWTMNYFKRLPYDDALILAWHVPKLTGFVLLPGEMPPISKLIPSNASRIGKEEYFEVLEGNYGKFLE